jgi:hypothetical protein
MRAWRVWGLDVWGNEEEGYEVNDRSDHGIICIIDEPTDEEILKAVDLDYRNPSKFDIDGDDGYLHIERVRDGRPLLQLEREDDDEADEECERDRNPQRRSNGLRKVMDTHPRVKYLLSIWVEDRPGRRSPNDYWYVEGYVSLPKDPTDQQIVERINDLYASGQRMYRMVTRFNDKIYVSREHDPGRSHYQLQPDPDANRKEPDDYPEDIRRKNGLRRVIQGDPVDLDEFTEGFLEAALWASNYWNPNDPDDDSSLQDVGWTPDNLPEEIRRQAKRECEEFQRDNNYDLQEYEAATGRSLEYQGHDALLDSCGRAAAFEEKLHENRKRDPSSDALGKRLSKASEKHFGQWDEYLNNELPDPPNP